MKNSDLLKQLQTLSVKERRSRGLGDSMEKVLKKFGVPSCESCKKRKEVLNKIFPYQRSLFK